MIKSKTTLSVLFILVVALFFQNCRKTTEVETTTNTDFFNVPENATESLKKIASELKKQNTEKEFIGSFSKKFGVPLWSHSLSNEQLTKDSILHFIPLSKEINKFSDNYISCLLVNNQYFFKLISKDSIEKTISIDIINQNWIRGCLNTIAYFNTKINARERTQFYGYYNSNIKNEKLIFEVSNKTQNRSSEQWGVSWIRYCQQTSGETTTTRYSSSIVPTYICWNVYTFSSGGTNTILGTSPYWYDNLGGNVSGNLNSSLNPEILSFISNSLELNETESLWLLENPNIALQINSYLNSFSPLPEEYKLNAKKHLERLMTDSQYKLFVEDAIITNRVNMENWINFYLGDVEGSDGVSNFYNTSYWDNPNLNLPKDSLPKLDSVVKYFPKEFANGRYSVMDVTKVYQMVGGEPYNKHREPNPNYQNACALRGSIALNKCGKSIPNISGTEKGGDNVSNYILAAKTFNKYMRETYGPATYSLTKAQINNDYRNIDKILTDSLVGKTAIYSLVKIPGQSVSGHVDLIINGKFVGGSAINGNVPTIDRIDIWVLKN